MALGPVSTEIYLPKDKREPYPTVTIVRLKSEHSIATSLKVGSIFRKINGQYISICDRGIVVLYHRNVKYVSSAPF